MDDVLDYFAQAADVLTSRSREVLMHYERDLCTSGSSLLLDSKSCEQTRAFAMEALVRAARNLRGQKATDGWERGSLCNVIGREKAQEGVTLEESLKAFAALFDAAFSIIATNLPSDIPRSTFIEIALTIQQSIMVCVGLVTASYLEHVREMHRRHAVKVAVIGGTTLVRQGLAGMLDSEQGTEVVVEAEAVAESAVRLRQHTPAVVLLDEERIADIKAAAGQIRAVSPSSRLIILTVFDEHRYTPLELSGIGADGYLNRNVSREELLAAVHATVRNKDNVVLCVSRSAVTETDKELELLLTKRQLEILLLAARGKNALQISSHLHLSVATVNRHFANIYKRLGGGELRLLSPAAIHSYIVCVISASGRRLVMSNSKRP